MSAHPARQEILDMLADGNLRERVRQSQKAKKEDRNSAGRYTLGEVDEKVSEVTGESIRRALEMAISSGELPAYCLGSNVPAMEAPRDSWLEVFGDDVEKWLAAKLPRVKFSFTSQAPCIVKSMQELAGEQSNAANRERKNRGIDLYKSGNFHSKNSAAASISQELGVAEVTARNWLRNVQK